MGDKTIAIIGARLNSSRLPRKQLLPLVGKPLIARLVDRLRLVQGLDDIVLATTADTYNEDLITWAQSYGVKVEAYSEDVNDLVGRVGFVARKHSADILLYICGDCPLLEPATLTKAIKAIKAHPDNDTAELALRPDGQKYIHEGFDIYRSGFWERMEETAKEPFEREHIGAIYKHLNKLAPRRLASYPDDDVFAGCHQRVSVDTSSDYAFMRRVYEDWYEDHPADTIVDLATVIKNLQQDASLSAANEGVRQRRVGEKCPDITILAEAGQAVGLGHLSRMIVAAQALQDYLSASVRLYIKGSPIENEALALLPHTWVGSFSAVPAHSADAVIVDVKDADTDVRGFLKSLPSVVVKVAVDQPHAGDGWFDHLWQPSMYISPKVLDKFGHKMDFGWQSFLLKEAARGKVKKQVGQKRLIVLSGGSDTAGLGSFLPAQLIEKLPQNVQIDWVQGPFATAPIVPVNTPAERFTIVKAPENLPAMLPHYDVALVVFGVSYFECLLAGVPAVVFDAIQAAVPAEWVELKRQFPDLVAPDVDRALEMLIVQLSGAKQATIAAVQQQMRQGPRNFALKIETLLTAKQTISPASLKKVRAGTKEEACA